MAEETHRLSEEELEAANAEELPDREAMTVMQPPHIVAYPIEPLPPVDSTEPLPTEDA
jgi:hypothetical protein